MINDWQAFLENNGAEFSSADSSRVDTFGNPGRERHLVLNGNILCDLTHLGLIRAEGEDAASFLQNQLSNDLGLVDDTHSQLNAYCTPKGRMLAIMRVIKRHDQYILRLPQELVENTLKRLNIFVMMAKVSLADAHEGLIRFGFSGSDAEKELEEAVGGYPASIDDSGDYQDVTIVRTPGIVPRFEIYAELEQARKLWDKLNVRATPVGASAWQLLDVLSGVPDIFTDTVEAYVPQMVNLQLVNGVSFKKGCYPGQEIVARMHYLGKLKRRMYLLHSETSDLPQVGTEIFSPDHNEPVGSVVSAAIRPDGNIAMLAVLGIKFIEDKASLHIHKPDGPKLTLEDLPYSFENG